LASVHPNHDEHDLNASDISLRSIGIYTVRKDGRFGVMICRVDALFFGFSFLC